MNGMDYTDFYKQLASRLQAYHRQHADTVDLLAEALYVTGISFPIANDQETLQDIDPFTFLASFTHKMLPNSQQRLAQHLANKLGVSYNDKIKLSPIPLLPLHHVRFFSNRSTQQQEIDCLWELLELLLETPLQTEALSQAISRYSKLNAAGREGLQWVFAWFYPHQNEELVGLLDLGAYPTKEFAQALLAAQNYKPPAINTQAFTKLIKAYVDQFGRSEQLRRDQLEIWKAVKRFNQTLRLEPEGFAENLKEALGTTNALLANTNNFHPHTEIIRLAKLDQESVYTAFADLLTSDACLPARILQFCNSITILYERFRDHFPRWQTRPCAHANFYVASIYLFMYDPQRYVLYSPTRAQRLAAALEYQEVFRPTDADVVEAYTQLCTQMLECLQRQQELLVPIKQQLESESGFVDNNNHVLLDNIIQASLSL